MQKRWVSLGILTALLVTTGLGCKGGTKEEQAAAKPVQLEYWSVAHDSSVIGDLTARYRANHAQVSIRFRRFKLEEFEKELLEALAEDRGPDIISLHNDWISKYQTKLLPMPASVSVPSVVVKKGQLSDERTVLIENTAMPSLQQMDRLFVPVVKKDVVRIDETNKPSIYGLPMALDSLVLFYNQDLLDQAGVPQPPSTWGELQEAVVASTRYDASGNILQAGGAFGTGKNVERSSDILTALLMQNGAQMSDSSGRATFHLTTAGQTSEEAPVVEALRFYTDFGNPTKQVYTWNKDLEKSLDAFTRGKAAFFFGYAYHIPQIKARAPKLNYRVLSLPQLNPDKPKNVANYWVETVSKKTKYPNEAWDLVNFLARAPQAELYAERTQKPAALRESIGKQLENSDLAPFAGQVLTADTWYRGRNPDTADSAMAEMIDFVHENRAREEQEDIYAEAINRAVSKINQSL